MKKFWITTLIILCILVLIELINEVDGQELLNSYNVYSQNDFEYKSTGDKLLFVVDFSNSMGEYLEHKTKVAQVKDCLRQILPQISNDTKVGMRVYGHTCNIFAYNACRSSELLAPLKENNSRSILSSISKLRPRGMTPITYSLKQAVKKDFAHLEGIKHIILLTDGGENCDESPCDFVMDLLQYRDDINIDVIALAVGDQDANNQLKCVALVTSGKFYNANTAADLKNSLEDSLRLQKEVQAEIINK